MPRAVKEFAHSLDESLPKQEEFECVPQKPKLQSQRKSRASFLASRFFSLGNLYRVKPPVTQHWTQQNRTTPVLCLDRKLASHQKHRVTGWQIYDNQLVVSFGALILQAHDFNCVGKVLHLSLKFIEVPFSHNFTFVEIDNIVREFYRREPMGNEYNCHIFFEVI